MTTEKETVLTEEQQAHAAQLSAEFSAHDPGQPAPGQPAPEEISSKGLAALAVVGATRAAVSFYPCLVNNFPDELQQEAVEKLAPLLDKYNVKSAFFEKWRLEFEAGAFFAGVIFTAWQTIEADKAARAKEVANEPQN